MEDEIVKDAKALEKVWQKGMEVGSLGPPRKEGQSVMDVMKHWIKKHRDALYKLRGKDETESKN